MAAPRRFRWGFVVIAVLAVALVLWVVLGHHKTEKTAKTPPVPVDVAKVASQDVPVTISQLGAAQAWQNVLIRAQVSGKVLSLNYREGSIVKAGQLLAVIDPAPFNAALMQAQGALARDKAQLEVAKIDLARYQTLVSQDSIARQTLDTQAALVKQDEGVVMIDQGAVDNAKINVGYTRITSPVTGRVGVKLVDAGNLVSTTDTTGLLTVAQITPIAVTFTVPEGDFERLAQVSGGFSKPLQTVAYSQDNGSKLGEGQLYVTDNHVDPATGTVQLKARFENPDQKLWPGQFVNVRLTLQTLQNVTTVPLAAVTQGPKGPYVYVVGADRTVSIRQVVVDTNQDQIDVIKSGLSVGETVVTDGQLSLKPGSRVAVRDPNAPVTITGKSSKTHSAKRSAS